MTSSSSRAKAFFYAFSAVIHLFFLLDFPVMPSLFPHSSWAMLHSHAYDEGLLNGKELCSTIGPWGVFYNRWYDPDHYAVLLMISALVALATGLIVARLLDGVAVRLAVPLAVLTAWIMGLNQDALFFALLLALVRLLSSADTKRVDLAAVLTTVLLAFFSNVKFSAFVGACAVIVLMELSRQLRGRRPWPLYGLAFVLGVPSFFLLAGQTLGNFLPFLTTSLEFARGYSESMQLYGPGSELVVFLLFAGAGLALTAYGLFREEHVRQQRGQAVLPLLCAALTAFLVFKGSFVRHDPPHVTTGYCFLSIWFGWMTAWSWRRPRVWPRAASTALLALSLLMAVSLHANELKKIGGGFGVLFQVTVERGLHVAELLSGDAFDRWDREYVSSLRLIREVRPLAPIDGTVDVYPTEYAVPLAHGMTVSPRPIAASFAAYTPRLSEINQQHLQGGSAPEVLLFEIRPIDEHFPALDDGASWPDILSWYDAVGTTGGFLVLRRRPAERPVRPRLAERRPARLGERVRLPDGGGLLFARVDFQKSLLGRAVGLLYKMPVLRMEVTTADGARRSYRVVPGMTRRWFLLSPLVESTSDFLAVSRGTAPAGARVVEVSFSEGAGIRGAYQESIQISFGR